MNDKSKRFLAIFIPIIIIGSVVAINSFEKDQTPEKIDNKFVTIEINDTKIKSEIAETSQQITKGLSGRRSLPKDEGMVFYLENRRVATFWMKDMLFPIDIIWIDDGKVVYIIEGAQPPNASRTPAFTPEKPATHVLEVNAGFAKTNNIKKDNFIRIPNID